MEVSDLTNLLSGILAVAGSGWLGIAASGLLIILFLVLWIYFKNLAAEYAYKKSKESEIQDQINNRKENDKVESGWQKAEEAIADKKTDPKEKKKRLWLS